MTSVAHRIPVRVLAALVIGAFLILGAVIAWVPIAALAGVTPSSRRSRLTCARASSNSAASSSLKRSSERVQWSSRRARSASSARRS